MVAGFIGLGGLLLTVFSYLHIRCEKNEKEIRANREDFHKVDKKLDILLATLEIKYPTAVEKAKKKNGVSKSG